MLGTANWREEDGKNRARFFEIALGDPLAHERRRKFSILPDLGGLSRKQFLVCDWKNLISASINNVQVCCNELAMRYISY